MRDEQDVRDVQQLVEKRGEGYGDSWKLAGRIVSQMKTYVDGNGQPWDSQYWHPVFMIVVKLCRALVSPVNPDHWRDIQGYAQLVLDDIAPAKAERRDTGT